MRKISIAKLFFTSLGVMAANMALHAQDAAGTAEAAPKSSGMSSMMLIIIGLLLLLSLGLALMVLRLTTILKQQSKPAGATETKSALGSWWANLDKKFFTKAVPVEKEADVLLDHDYDGIKELDNALPPWWKWGFYITVILAVFYMFRFHVWKTGPTPEDEYNREMKVAAMKLDEYRKKAGNMVDEKTVKMADAAGIAAGKTLFQKGQCVACHTATGGGGIGPNLTDDYWLHGGSINDVFKVIKIGVPEKGMQSWEKTYSPAEIQNLASYILSLKGTKPAGGKDPQGTLYVPAAPAADSAGAKKDSVTADVKPVK
jgi:cytochrome c oxidase cbb3-type subunit III